MIILNSFVNSTFSCSFESLNSNGGLCPFGKFQSVSVVLLYERFLKVLLSSQCAKILVEHGCDVNSEDKDFLVASDLAKKCGHFGVAKFLRSIEKRVRRAKYSCRFSNNLHSTQHCASYDYELHTLRNTGQPNKMIRFLMTTVLSNTIYSHILMYFYKPNIQKIKNAFL